MADTKISAMPEAATLDGTEIVPLVQGGLNVQDTVTNFVSETIQVAPGDFRDDLGLGTIAVQDADNVSITGGSISNTTVAGYVPTTRTLTAGVGLSGGGDLSANRSFAIANTGVTAATYGSSTKIPVVTFNAQGQATSASEVTLSPASIGAHYFSAYQDGTTTLTSAITNGSVTTPIQVADTSKFSASGFLLIGDEIIQYTTKTATSFDGTITRGVKGTSGSGHALDSYVTEIAATTATTAIGMQIDTVTLSNGITCTVPDSKVYFSRTGTYNIQFSAQLLNFSTAEDNVTIWLRVDGSDVSMSAGVVEVLPKHGSSPGAVIATWNYVDTYTAGSYFELYWNAGGNAVLGTYPPGTSPTRPGAPSLILTVTQVA